MAKRNRTHQPSTFQISVFGAGGVGKTALISRFITGKFPADDQGIVEDQHHLRFVTHKPTVDIRIIDHSGRYQSKRSRHKGMVVSDAFILVHSLADADTFDHVQTLREEILALRGKDRPPIVVVGNSADLNNNTHDRVLYDSIVCMDWEHSYVRTSAKHNDSICEVFMNIFQSAEILSEWYRALQTGRKSRQPRSMMEATWGRRIKDRLLYWAARARKVMTAPRIRVIRYTCGI